MTGGLNRDIIIFNVMYGVICVNPFLIPKESVYQAERLKDEFNKLGVKVDIVSDGYLRSLIENGKLKSELCVADFVVYLDKDKYLSGVLNNCGVKLFNSHSAIRLCDDKAETCIALGGSGLKIPKTIFGALCYSVDCEIADNAVKSIGRALSFPLIVKESYGSMGKGIYKVDDEGQLRTIMEKIKLRPHLFQEYISIKVGVDVRVIVIGGKAVAAMERRNENDFRSNVARGGLGVKITLSEKFKTAAEKVATILGLDYCGVDLLYGADGEPYICEVNSNAFIGGIESVTGINVAKLYAEYIINKVK